MTAVVIALSVLFCSPAFAEMSQFYNNHIRSGATYGNPNAIERYSEQRGSLGTMFNSRESDISQYYLIGPNSIMHRSGTIFTMPIGGSPMGNTPMGVPSAAPGVMIPSQPFGPGLTPTPFGR